MFPEPYDNNDNVLTLVCPTPGQNSALLCCFSNLARRSEQYVGGKMLLIKIHCLFIYSLFLFLRTMYQKVVKQQNVQQSAAGFGMWERVDALMSSELR